MFLTDNLFIFFGEGKPLPYSSPPPTPIGDAPPLPSPQSHRQPSTEGGLGGGEMEGRVDENNRSLFANPFVSTVLIHLSINPPHPHPRHHTHTRSLPPTLPQPQQLLHQAPSTQTTLAVLPKLTLIPQTVKRKHGSSSTTPTPPPPHPTPPCHPTPTQLLTKISTQTQLCPRSHLRLLSSRWEPVGTQDCFLFFSPSLYANIF